jgi:site-specific DNA recombinase
VKGTRRLSVAGYLRVSDPSQVERYSLDAQRAEIQRWCRRQGHELVRVYSEEGLTARSERMERRPQLVALLDDAQRGLFDIVVVHMLDRWSRNVGVQRQALQRLGDTRVVFASVVEGFDFTTPSGKLMLTMLGGVAEFFSDQLALHVSKAQRQRAELGLPVGPVPFDYTSTEPGAAPQVDPREAEAVRDAFAQRAVGASTGEIAARLNTSGFGTRQGHGFTAHAVKDMLNTRFYCGVVTYQGQEFPGQHAAIIPEDLYLQVQARRQRRTGRRQVRGVKGVLQGMISCARCGRPLQSDRQIRGAPMYRERHCYECETNGHAIMAYVIDDQVRGGGWPAPTRTVPSAKESTSYASTTSTPGFEWHSPCPSRVWRRRRFYWPICRPSGRRPRTRSVIASSRRSSSASTSTSNPDGSLRLHRRRCSGPCWRGR